MKVLRTREPSQEPPTIPKESLMIKLFEEANSIAVLTGAGVSTASGILDFKTTDETWPYEEPRELMISAPFWRHNPVQFWEAYRFAFGKKIEDNLKPSEFHLWLADLEKSGKEVSILTQNVDGLHQKAGSTRVIEAHGSASRAVCIRCRQVVSMESVADVELPLCSSDQCLGLLLSKPSVLKPDVSLFFEGVYGMSEFREVLESTDLLLVAGTRLEVGPVNELPFFAMGTKADERSQQMAQPTVWANATIPPEDYNFTYSYLGDLDEFSTLIGA